MINFPELSPIDEVNYEIAVINNNIAIATTQYNETGCGLEKCKLMMQIVDLENEREDAIEYRNTLKETSCQNCTAEQELNVREGQIEYLQDLVDFYQEELADAENAIDYWVEEAERNSKANDLLHDDIIDLQMKLRDTEKCLADTSERAADYWKRLKTLEASND